MAITDIKLSGKVFTDAGTAVNGATVALLETGTSTEEASTTTNSSGEWSFTETSLDATYDVKISVGSSVRYILWSDEITVTGLDAASVKIRGVEGAAAPLYFFADQADDAGDGWRIQASASDTLAIGSDKASAGTIIDYLTITNGANAAASTVTVGGILAVTTTLDVNGTADYDVTDYDIASSGDIDLVSTNDAAAAIYLRENAGTSGTVKIHADQGTSVAEGAESVTILSDAGGVGVRSTANLANAVNITVDGGSTSSMTLFNDQGTSVTEGAASIQLLSDDGGIGIKSTANLASAILLTADGGTSETIKIHADRGTSESSIQLLSDAGGVDINAATGKDVDIAGGTVNLTSSDDAASAIYVRANAGTSETIKVHADQGTSESSIQLLSDAGGVDIDAATGKDVDIAGGTVNLTSSDNAASAIYLRANAGTSETIKIHADQGTGTGSISAVSDVGGITLDAGLDIVLSADGGNVTMDDGTSTIFDFNVDDTTLTIHDDQDTGDTAVITMAQHGALSIVTTDDDAAAANIQITADGTAELAGTTVTLDSAADIELEATDDINIPVDVGLTFGDDGEKIEGDGTDLTISGNIINLSGAVTATGILKTEDSTAATSTTDGSLQTGGGLSVAGDAIIGDDLKLLSDSAVFGMGVDSDFTITHDGSGAAVIDIGGSGGSITNVGASGNDWTSSSLTFAAASSVKTSAGILTIDGDDGLLLKTTGSTGSYITRGTYHISQVVTKTSIADNSATAVFTITTTDGLGNIDGGGYACHVRALVGHSLNATASDFQAARSFQAHFARAMSTDGAQGNSSAVAEIAESASGVAYAGNASRRDIGTITMTTADTSEYVQTVSFTVDLTNPGAGGSIGTAEVIAEVDLIYYGFQVAPVIAVA